MRRGDSAQILRVSEGDDLVGGKLSKEQESGNTTLKASDDMSRTLLDHRKESQEQGNANVAAGLQMARGDTDASREMRE